MHTILDEDDEIVSIEYVGVRDTIDINTNGNRLFYANDILTHNSAVEEIEFDHSHISGGLSKIQTADNVIGIFTSRAMKDRGRYQIQFMKTRSSSGVGQKVDLEFDVDTLRIKDLVDESESSSAPQSTIYEKLKKTSTVIDRDPSEGMPAGKIKANAGSSRIRELLAGLNSEKD